MAHPSLRLGVVLFTLGTLVLQTRARLPHPAATLALLPLVAVASWPRLPIRLRLIGHAATWCLAGFMWAAVCAHDRLAEALDPALEGRDLTLSGTVAAMPDRTAAGVRFEFIIDAWHGPDTDAVSDLNGRRPGSPIPTRVALTWNAERLGPLPDLLPGDRWSIPARLRQPHGNANAGAFDVEAWLLERGIRATGTVRAGARPLPPLAQRWSWRLERLRTAIRARLLRVLGGQPYAGVLVALTVGDQGGIPQDQWRVFWRTGVGHLISISGLHITMMAGVLAGAVKWVWGRVPGLAARVPTRRAAVAGGVLAALVYALVAGYSVPTQRTLYMVAVMAWAAWSGTVASAARLLCAALFVVVLADPWAVLAAGFWLSFGAVGVILYASVCRTGRPHWLAAASRTQWAVTLGLVPLLLSWFQQVSLVSPAANAFAVPLVSLVVVPLALLGCLPGFDWALYGAHALFALCMAPLQWLATPAWAVWTAAAPSAWMLVLGTLGALWILMPSGVPGRGAGWLLMAPLCFADPPRPAEGAFRATVLDVGQGLAVLVQTRHHALVYDAGPSFGPAGDAGGRIVVPALRAAGIGRLDGLIITHRDADHSGGGISILDQVPVDWLASSLAPGHPMLRHAARSLPCFRPQHWHWDGVEFEMLHPAPEAYAATAARTNDLGCVLAVTAAGGRLLLPADIEAASEQELLAAIPGELRADILVAPHHGSRTSSTAAFIAAVSPAHVIFSAGYRNRFGHPRVDVVARYRAAGVALYRTDADGAVAIDVSAGGVTLERWRFVRPRYWYGR